ncbi:MAG: FMN-binding protein [Planctomycetota bacterium]|nr:MAG: FMN-binding protein [Planctomycetota bacterium]
MKHAAAILFLFVGLGVVSAQQAKVPPPKPKSKAEVLAFIKKTGSTPPDWFAATPLNYPKTLDLSWSPPPQGSPWDPGKNVGQFIWTSINENEARWKEGIKFLHHMLTVNKDKPATVKQVMNALGNMYHDLHQDWARAAFWRQMAGEADSLELAHSYFKLGSKDMAVEILNRYGQDNTRHASVVRLWAEIGEPAKALQLAEQMAGSIPDAGNLAAGDVCRANGRYAEALVYYQKAAAASGGSRDIDQNKKRAQASLDAIKSVELLDLKKVPDGKYKADSFGYSGQVEVEVSVAAGKITDIRVSRHTEKQYYSSISETCANLIKKQGAKGVDATSGATITSEAIINATVKALPKK